MLDVGRACRSEFHIARKQGSPMSSGYFLDSSKWDLFKVTPFGSSGAMRFLYSGNQEGGRGRVKREKGRRKKGRKGEERK